MTARSVLPPAIVQDPVVSAKSAGLRYVRDDSPGATRVRRGSSFVYLDAHGRPIRDPATLARIRSLAIPPAWTHVWICPSPSGHIQATGRDARGRKQYRYHPKWRQVRDATKFHRMASFARVLPEIRRAVERHLALPGLPREKVLATVVRLLERTLIRVGNEEYARENHSYGLTTLQQQHVKIQGHTLRFRFRGKHGKLRAIEIDDPRLAKILKRISELPGEELFHWIDDDGKEHPIASHDVNDYLRAISGGDFTAKDFRTWSATMLAATELRSVARAGEKIASKRSVAIAIERVAQKLGNTKTVCRNCYVHPEIVSSYLAGEMLSALEALERVPPPRDLAELSPDEARVVAFLERRAAREGEALATKLRKSLAATRKKPTSSRVRARDGRVARAA